MPRKWSRSPLAKPSIRPLRVSTIGPMGVLRRPEDTPVARSDEAGAARRDIIHRRGCGGSVENVLSGVRVLEVAQWWFVPSAGAVLADWGAEVIKIEHPA